MNATGGYKYAINNATTPTAYHLGTTLEQTATQTTLEDADRDFSSSGASWVNDATSPDNSVPFDGNQDAITPIYDVSNQWFAFFSQFTKAVSMGSFCVVYYLRLTQFVSFP